ncbi:MAG TPA: hypothetical protein VEI97_20240 [bacterium]|nr:hypothetical protein [bacterium]
MQRRFLAASILTALAALTSCSGGSSDPATPVDLAGGDAGGTIPSAKPMLIHEFMDLQRGTGVLAAYEVTVEAGEDPRATIEPARHSMALADTYQVDISTILRGNPCGDCLKVRGLGLDPNGVLTITFEMAHPFGALDLRKDLHVFDVRGHLVSGRGVRQFTGIQSNLGNGDETIATNAGLMLNADGYSTFFDGVVEGFIGASIPGNARPYKFFWKDFGAGNVDPGSPSGFTSINNPRGHSVFPMGGKGSDNRAAAVYRIALDPGDNALNFLLVVDASYGVSAAGKPERLTPRYFLPLFNQVAPVVVEATAGEGLLAGDPASGTTVEVRIGDWQAGLKPPDLGFDPATAELDDIPYLSDLAGVKLHIPGVLTSAITLDPSASTGGAGTPSDPYRFTVPVTNQRSAAAGVHWGIVVAEDQVTTSLGDGPTPLQRDTVTPDTYHDFNTYQLFPVMVAEITNLTPTADIAADRTTIRTGEAVEFCPGPGAGDPDGTLTLWEYDYGWDGNPATFSADESKLPSDPSQCVNEVFINGDDRDLIITVGMRVTDDGTPALRAIDAIEITVQPAPDNEPPTAELVADRPTPFTGQPVTFSPGPGTADPDGTIVLYEYDFDYDGSTFDVDAVETDPTPVTTAYNNPGASDLLKAAALRVTDNGGAEGLDTLELTIRPADPTPEWDFEDTRDTLSSLGFTLLGTNGLEKGPIPPCQADKQYSNDPPSSYNAPPAGSTWGLVEGIGNPGYGGNTSYRALEESGSTAAAGEDNRYWTDAIYAIRTPVIPLPSTANNLYLDLHHWFETDIEYEVDDVPAGTGGQPIHWLPMPNPGLVTNYDGATVWVRTAPGGVPTGDPIRLDLTGPQASEPYWVTFKNAIGYRWDMLTLFEMTPTAIGDWLLTNYRPGVDQGFSGMSYTDAVADRRHAVPDAAVPGGWKLNPTSAQWIDSRFDLTPWAGQQIVLEFRFASKQKNNPQCRTEPAGTTIFPPCIECMQNLEALVESSVNHRRSKGWRIDRVAVVEE